jgi:hypothetical protein
MASVHAAFCSCSSRIKTCGRLVLTNAAQMHAINCAIAAKSSTIGSRNVLLIGALWPGSKLLEPGKLS